MLRYFSCAVSKRQLGRSKTVPKGTKPKSASSSKGFGSYNESTARKEQLKSKTKTQFEDSKESKTSAKQSSDAASRREQESRKFSEEEIKKVLSKYSTYERLYIFVWNREEDLGIKAPLEDFFEHDSDRARRWFASEDAQWVTKACMLFEVQTHNA